MWKQRSEGTSVGELLSELTQARLPSLLAIDSLFCIEAGLVKAAVGEVGEAHMQKVPFAALPASAGSMTLEASIAVAQAIVANKIFARVGRAAQAIEV